MSLEVATLIAVAFGCAVCLLIMLAAGMFKRKPPRWAPAVAILGLYLGCFSTMLCLRWLGFL